MKFYILACIIFSVYVSARTDCDKSKPFHGEGVIGEKSSFPWIGVLRVHIHDHGKFRVAVTGLLLVKKNYGIASADDVSKVSKNYFKRDSRVMFIIKDHEAWFCNVKDYIIHPEYQFDTYNTIALVELASENSSRIQPICWPHYSFNASNQLYALGYTDQNKILEKVIYKMEYVNSTLCEEFYNRAGFKSGSDSQNYVCGYSSNNKGHCEWDNGMVLASNSTGYWSLIGFGVHGPGCSAPARFISIHPYLQWIEAMIGLYP